MTPEKWERIKKVLEATLDDPLWKRAESVQRLCLGDRELEAEVNKLLAADECAGSFLEVPAVETISEFCEEPLSFLADEVISDRFRIIRFLNSGGMGEVYEAWDSELQERVALKTIRAEIASVPGVIDRFKREVKQARGVSHPNVCRVYDLFSTERNSLRIWFLTMQLLEGQTLLDRIREKGAFSKKECVGLIQQMVAGLNAAHELGIAHGDFKSGNIMLVSGERGQIRAVITDFGLAFKVLVSPKGGTGPSGQGTPDYMAPERRQGGEVGLAADQYSLGVVMCEMLTGLRPRHVPGAARKADVSLPSSSNLDARSRGVICRCLRTEPEGRFKSVEEVLWVLNGTRERGKSGWWFGTAAALTITAAAVVLIGIAVDRPRVEGAAQLTPATDLSGGPSLARDGKVVAYESDRGQTGNLDIWVQHLPFGEPLRLTSNPAEDLDPSISPDGAAVVFRSERNGGGIYISTARGDGEHLLVSGGKNPRYSPDGRQVVYWVGEEDDTQPSGKLFLLTLDGGVPVRLASNFADARLPVWSSDGKFILFVGCLRGDQTMLACSEWWATSTNGQVIQETGALSLLHKDQILPIGSIGGWYGDNVLFSGRRATATSIWELKIPEQTLRASGKPVQLTSGETRDVTPAYADDGTIAYAHLSGALHVWRISQAVNPNKAVGIKITEDPAADISPSVSQDGRWLVFSRGNGSHRDIWVKDMRSGTESVFATSSQDQLSPLIDDSGENVVFESREADVPGLFIAMRGQKPTKLCSGCSNPTGWFDGDRAVLFREGSPSKIGMVDLRTKETRTLLGLDNASLGQASWAPQTQFLVFTESTEGGKKQVFSVLVPKDSLKPVGKWTAITDESEWSDKPRWSSDGKVVFYLSTRDGFTCVWGRAVDPHSGVPLGSPFPVMHYHNLRFSPARVVARSFNLSVSGDSIYLNVGESSASIWTGKLKRPRFFSLSR